MAKIHTTIPVGQFSCIATNPLFAQLVNGTASISVNKFRLDETMVESTQLLDNAFIVVLVDGSTITLTNNVKAGTLKFACVKHSNDPMQGDMVAMANYLLDTGATGGTNFSISFPFNVNGTIETITMNYSNCNVKTVKQLNLPGNNVATYEVEWTFADVQQG